MRRIIWARPRVVTLLLAATAASGGVACDDNDELRNIERGTDPRPAIEATPPDEGS